MAKDATLPHAQGGRKRGFPPHATDRNRRMEHLRVAYAHLVLKRPTKWIVEHFGISRRTSQYWCAAALKYDDPEAQTLREKLGRAKH